MSGLSFGLGDATRNGSTFGSWATGAADYSIGSQAPMSSGGGGALSYTAPSGSVGSGTGGTGGGVGAQTSPGWFGEHGKMNTIIGGVQVLGSLWNSFQQHKMAKEQMNFAREQWDTNLANQTQTYNTALEDRIRSRHFTEGKGAAETDSYIQENSL
ncbi:Strucutural protein, N4 gp52-like protein [Roseovarius Plymouth podovirus 1]|uniref:Strucutural protein, N4 gp52-like protein n=2 Tax=Roseovarius Plymouth podovirus 1 TaxID=926474 RepID=K4Q4V1_9CAUD|nr:Strucutural protein, N4 gp52-like protein [Roseovarius Plymouth podovirus 1]CBW47058.1 structural protein, N4 gp52-like protein [Roseovarius sp. 217 phage 1]CBX87994.1 Strucutural protein, N4 gp52-like protein [Roseovarius Plymouth podovirus 1]